MRARIAKPTSWMDVMNVKFSDVRTIVNGSMTTEPPVVTGTRGTAFGFGVFTLTADTLTIDQYRVLSMFVDEADRFQQSYADQMGIADFQGKKISEYLEAQMLAQHASWTDFGATDLANTGDDDVNQITPSASNIDDLIRAIKRKQNVNNGVDFAVEKGRFIIWRASDFELLEGFVQAVGFNTADMALKNGIPPEKAFHYMGVDHYLSTQHTANHVFAGIKKMGDLGILRGTFGRVKFVEDPADGNGDVSGLGIRSRVDYGWNWSTFYKEFYMDVNVV